MLFVFANNNITCAHNSYLRQADAIFRAENETYRVVQWPFAFWYYVLCNMYYFVLPILFNKYWFN